MRRTSVLAIVATFTCGMSAASAADMPVRPAPAPVAVYDWTGIYVGANAGYAWGNADATSTFTCPSVSFPVPVSCHITNPVVLESYAAIASGRFKAPGFIGGVQSGYNVQTGGLVLGIEVDFNAFNLKGSRTNTARAAGPLVRTASPSTSIETDWLFTARGRLGWTFSPSLLVYATGGLALTELRVANAFPTPPEETPPFEGSSRQKHERIGYVVGGGLEWALNRHWSLKGEYLYLNFRSIETTAQVNTVAAPESFRTSVDLNVHIARLGINYKL